MNADPEEEDRWQQGLAEAIHRLHRGEFWPRRTRPQRRDDRQLQLPFPKSIARHQPGALSMTTITQTLEREEEGI
jgi:hypothetical protein